MDDLQTGRPIDQVRIPEIRMLESMACVRARAVAHGFLERVECDGDGAVAMGYGGDLKSGPVRFAAKLVGHFGADTKAAPVGPACVIGVRLEECRCLSLHAAVDADDDRANAQPIITETGV